MAVLTQAIKGKASELGFDLCGIAPADNFPELDFLDEWLARGYAGDMAYMSRSAGSPRRRARRRARGAQRHRHGDDLPHDRSDSGDDSTQPLSRT